MKLYVQVKINSINYDNLRDYIHAELEKRLNLHAVFFLAHHLVLLYSDFTNCWAVLGWC